MSARALNATLADFIDPAASGMASMRARTGLSQQQFVGHMRTDLTLATYRMWSRVVSIACAPSTARLWPMSLAYGSKSFARPTATT